MIDFLFCCFKGTKVFANKAFQLQLLKQILRQNFISIIKSNIVIVIKSCENLNFYRAVLNSH